MFKFFVPVVSLLDMAAIFVEEWIEIFKQDGKPLPPPTVSQKIFSPSNVPALECVA